MGDQEGAGKVTGIWHVVRLREMLQKWQSSTLGPKKEEDGVVVSAADAGVAPPSGISPAVDKRLKRAAKAGVDSDDENCNSPEPPPDVPKGYLAVYVGQEHRRFVIPTSYLGEPVFKELLRKAEEEFGFEHDGAITFPCEIETFKYILQCTNRQHKNKSMSKNKNQIKEESLLVVVDEASAMGRAIFAFCMPTRTGLPLDKDIVFYGGRNSTPWTHPTGKEIHPGASSSAAVANFAGEAPGTLQLGLHGNEVSGAEHGIHSVASSASPRGSGCDRSTAPVVGPSAGSPRGSPPAANRAADVAPASPAGDVIAGDFISSAGFGGNVVEGFLGKESGCDSGSIARESGICLIVSAGEEGVQAGSSKVSTGSGGSWLPDAVRIIGSSPPQGLSPEDGPLLGPISQVEGTVHGEDNPPNSALLISPLSVEDPIPAFFSPGGFSLVTHIVYILSGGGGGEEAVCWGVREGLRQRAVLWPGES
ncbi:hypothetical protein Taro_034559 [Colocasia esculenta]|uniref:Uncharacterized protein n=1 Tax=Colocasia esculenta TaxID=4460 RepID=A0A843W394_COLES|nr:hypothetical protein [Colocasia esculenta]